MAPGHHGDYSRVPGHITTVEFQPGPWMAFGELIYSRGHHIPFSLFLFITLCTGLFIQQHTPFGQARTAVSEAGKTVETPAVSRSSWEDFQKQRK